jgi:hypothetical protein
MYDNGSFSQNVADAFAPCNDGEIRFLSGKHNIQTAFKRCGSNNFAHFQWAPDGLHLYFQLTHGAHIMNGEKKTITVVPTEVPAHRAGWLTKNILAVPLGPAENDTRDRVVLYNRTAHTMHTLHPSIAAPRDLQPWDDKGQVMLLTGIGQDGQRHPYLLDTATGEVERALRWLSQPIEHLHLSRENKLVAWSTAKDTEIAQVEDGKTIHLLPGITRAVIHQDGAWAALETLGAPISHFDQKAWDQSTPEQRAREEVRRDEWLARQPDWVSREAHPPEVQLLNMKDGARFRITFFYGDRVQWYPFKRPHLAFMMWGIEGKQLNRNVAFTNMGERLRMLAEGQLPTGIERVTLPAAEAE